MAPHAPLKIKCACDKSYKPGRKSTGGWRCDLMAKHFRGACKA